MKSMIVSVLYVAWRLGQNPGAKFICISYGDDLAHDLSAMARRLMTSVIYSRIFPQTVLDKKSVDHLTTTRGGARYATAVGSDITGFGADEIIIDDPMQPDDAGSPLVKERVFSWVQSSVLTRFNDPRKGALILVMHRLAPDDLSATLEATGCDLVLKLPLVAEQYESFGTEGGDRLLMERQPGQVLNPERLNAKELARLKDGLAPHVFEAQYQQRPTVGGSGMLSVSSFRRYCRHKPPPFAFKIHSWDVGATITGNASVCTKWGVLSEPGQPERFFLTDVIKLQAQLPNVRAAIKAQDKADRPALIILDDRGVGLGLLQELREEGLLHVNGLTKSSEPLVMGEAIARARPNLSKIELFGRAALAIANGLVFIPEEAPWLESFLFEVAAFPNIADKDQVDSMSQLLAYGKRALYLARSELRSR
jgi:predicted phage terminase large subunit-like protein